MKARILRSMLVIVLAAALVGGSSTALFTAAATNVGTSSAAGPVDITLGQTVLEADAGNMAPGDTRSGSFTVTNVGSLALRYRVTTATIGALFGGATPAVVGGLADDQNVVLAPSAQATVTFTVHLPVAAGNAYQGTTGTVNFTVNAVQTSNDLALAPGKSRTNDAPPNPGPAFRVAQIVNGQIALNFGTYPAGNNRNFPQVLIASNFSDRTLTLSWNFCAILAPFFAPGVPVRIPPGGSVTLGFKLDTKPGDPPGEYFGTLFLSGMDGLIAAALPARLRLVEAKGTERGH